MQYLYAQALPLVLQNQQHNFLLEKYYQTVSKLIKEKGAAIENEQKNMETKMQYLDQLLTDEVIQRRLLELQSVQLEPEPTIQVQSEKRNGKKDGR